MNKMLSIIYNAYITVELFMFWLDTVSDRGIVWVMDSLMGEHEEIENG